MVESGVKHHKHKPNIKPSIKCLRKTSIFT